MGDLQLVPVIQSVSYFYLFLPFLAITRGYFQGQMEMILTSLSQVVEQVVRVGILLTVAFYFPKSSWSFYEMGTKVYQSAWISAIFAVLLLFLFIKNQGHGSEILRILKPKFSVKMGKRLLIEGLVIILVVSLLILFNLSIHSLFLNPY